MAKPKVPALTAAANPAVVVPTTSLVASAVRYSGKVPRIHNHQNQTWQLECYRHYAICGEARVAARFFGRAMSRAVLTTTRLTDGVAAPVTDGDVHELLEDLFNGKDGQAQMLESIGIHLTIAGECYLIGRTEKITDEDDNVMSENKIWEVVSVMEVKVKGSQWAINYGEGYEEIVLEESDDVIRIWQPNPAKRVEADSPFRSMLPILTEIEWHTRHIFAQLSSRLAGAGILFLPQGMTFPQPPEREGQNRELMNEADLFMLALGEAMMAPINDPSSPSALIPLIVTAPEDTIDKARLMTFWSELDAASKDMRAEAIGRFAVGMDLPAEQILGMSSNGGTGGGTSNGVSHWGAWQIEESTIKMFVEPMLELVVNAIVVGYIYEYAPEADDKVGWDTSALRLRPDRSKEAIELWMAGAISTAKMLLENGFSAEDMPDPDEIKMHFLRKIASGSATPEQVEAALDMLGIQLNSSRFELEQGDTRETRPDPSLEDLPVKPRTPGEDAPVVSDPETPSAALLAACDGLVYRAIEKAGNRYINAGRRGKDRDKTLSPFTVHIETGAGMNMLSEDFSYAPMVLAGLGHVDRTVSALKAYCSMLYADKVPHSRERLADFMSEVDL